MIRRVVYDSFGKLREGEFRRASFTASGRSVPQFWRVPPGSFIPDFKCVDGRTPGFLYDPTLGPIAWHEQIPVMRLTGYNGNHPISGQFDGETPSTIYVNDLGNTRFGNKELLVLYRTMNSLRLCGGPMFFMGIRSAGAYSAVTKGWGPDSVSTYYLNRCLSLGFNHDDWGHPTPGLWTFKVGLAGVYWAGNTARNDYGGTVPRHYNNTVWGSFYYPWNPFTWYWNRFRIEWPRIKVKMWAGHEDEPAGWNLDINISKELWPNVYILGDFYDRKGAGICGFTHSGWASNDNPYGSSTLLDVGFWGESVLNICGASIPSWKIVS